MPHNTTKAWWQCNGALKVAAWGAALIFAAGGGWSKLNAIQRSVDHLALRISSVEQVLMKK